MSFSEHMREQTKKLREPRFLKVSEELWLQIADRLEYYERAEKELHILPPPRQEDEYQGLKGKYLVYKADDHSPVVDCFVLSPKKDPAARHALMCYGMSTPNEVLGQDILVWVSKIEDELVEAAEAGHGTD